MAERLDIIYETQSTTYHIISLRPSRIVQYPLMASPTFMSKAHVFSGGCIYISTHHIILS